MVVKDIQVREALTMDAATTTFTNRRGYTLSFRTLFILGTFFVCTLIAVSFIVYNFATCPGLSGSQKAEEPRYHSTTKSTQGRSNSISNGHDSDSNENRNSLDYENSKDSSSSSSPSSSPSTPSVIEDVRLPRSVIPLAYNISLIPFLIDGNFTFHGDVRMHVIVKEDCNNITLHAADLRITEDDVIVRVLTRPDDGPSSNQETDESLQVKRQYFVEAKQFFVIEFVGSLKKDAEYEVHIKFVGNILDYLQGFYRSSYEVGKERRWLASTQFQPTDARRAFPCFDEPALKANFTLNIARPSNMTAISNMPKIPGEEKNVDNLPGYVWDNFEESLPMSTYLVAYAVSDFVNRTNGNFSVWTRSDAIQSANYALIVGPKILRFLEEFFDIPFPLPKIDMIALPDFQAGAMENWGLITYRETAMLFEEGVSATTNKQRIASVVGHELAHQWFGNLVTPSWWSDIWLNEGFASYIEYLAVDAIEPQWKTMDQFVVNEVQNVFLLDALSSSHKISVEVGNPDEINEIFDKISYGKGSTIIRMMSHFLTSKVFRSGLTKYLREMAYRSAEQDDLWRFLTTEALEHKLLESSVSVKEIMDTWTLQTGFPLLRISRDPETLVVRIEQERFVYSNDTQSDESEDPLWWIPLTYTTSNELDFENTRPSNWIPRTKVYEIDNMNLSTADWYIFNIQQSAYYRVHYDNNNWNAITSYLMNPKSYKRIAPSNRAQLIDDAMNLARAGYMSYDVALNITTYLVHEDDHVPWKAAITAFNFIDSMLIQNGDYHLLKSYLLKLLKTVYFSVGFDDRRDQSDMLTLFKRIEILSLACHLGHSDCIHESSKHFHNWMFEPKPDVNNPISPNLRNIVYCTAIQHGTEREWNFAYERYLSSKVSSEKEIILTALGCTKEPWILSRYLKRALSDDMIKKQDIYRVFAAVSSNVVGQQIAFDFIRSHWNEMKIYLGSSISNLNVILKLTTRRMNSKFMLKELQSFIKANHNETGRSIKQAVEQIQVNIDWMDKNYDTIIEWLTNQSKMF